MFVTNAIASISFSLIAVVSGSGSQQLGSFPTIEMCEATKAVAVQQYRAARLPAMLSCSPVVQCTQNCFLMKEN
jgi:type III secretory pathway lipoprotein EscJ